MEELAVIIVTFIALLGINLIAWYLIEGGNESDE